MEATRDVLGELVLDVEYDLDASLIDQMDNLIKAIAEQVPELETTTLKMVKENYEKKKTAQLMETIDRDRISLLEEVNEVKIILKEVGQLMLKLTKLLEFTDDLEKCKDVAYKEMD